MAAPTCSRTTSSRSANRASTTTSSTNRPGSCGRRSRTTSSTTTPAPFFEQNFYCPTGSDCRSSFDFHDNDEHSTQGAASFQIQSPAATYTLGQFQSTQSEELGSISADPQFANPTYGHDDFTLSATSPALAIGFVPFDPSTAGRTTATLMPPAAPTRCRCKSRPIRRPSISLENLRRTPAN